MRWISVICFLTIGVTINQLHAASHIMYDKANQLYRNKNYDSAAQLYQQMLNDGYVSADLYYNTGNAYYRLNKIGMAIWCYEKAIAIHPEKVYIENLALARKRIKEPIESVRDIFFIRWWQSLYNLFTLNTWALLGWLGFLTGLLLLAVYRLRHIPDSAVPGAVFCFVFSACSLLFLSVRAYNEQYHFRGIIMTPETPFLSVSKKSPQFLHEGIYVQVLDLHAASVPGMETMVLVRLPDGREGRVALHAIKKL